MTTGCLPCCGNDDDGNTHILERIDHERSQNVSSHEVAGHLPVKDYESLDYDQCYNKPYEEYLENQRKEHSLSKIEIFKWIITFLIGFSTGSVAFLIDTIVKQLSKLKFSTVDHLIDVCSADGCLVISLLVLVLFNVGFVAIAAILTVLEPVAAGSGIPEIKCYLNGVRVPRVVRFKSFIAKAVGVLFSVAGGMFVGKEGPMIHSGAIIGAGIPQFQSITFKKLSSKFDFFRTDRDKRDFVSGGAAAGVAAAFGAPIGGVLFSLEEGCSFWNQKLTWRTFFCSMSATFTLNFFLSGLNGNNWGFFYMPGLINFGIFKCTEENKTDGVCRLWTALDLFMFILMGLIGGLLGALFNHLNKVLTVYRMKHVSTKHKSVRILEALLVAMVTTLVAFIGAMTLGNCTQFPSIMGNASSTETEVRTYFCKEGYYNDMATLFFNSQEEAIKQLFHQEGQFSLRTLGLFFIFFFLLACWTYGVGVPSGLFVPCLLCGAAYGRFVATLLTDVIGYDNGVYSGTFALVGAAAFLGGVVRMTISLTVILIESTNEISYGLPLMIVLMVAKWSGDFFNEGLYDIHIHLKGVPLLEWDIPDGMERLKARDVMSNTIDFIFPRTRVAVIQRILKTTAHHAFPVVSIIEKGAMGQGVDDEGQLDPADIRSNTTNANLLKFEGMIMRSQLVVLIKNGVYMSENSAQEGSQPYASYDCMTADYPRYPDMADISNNRNFDTKYILVMLIVEYGLSHEKNNVDEFVLCIDSDQPALKGGGHNNENEIIDARPYMNVTPYTVYPESPVPQVFHLFRSMGLRHLPVVDHFGQVQGIITRHNLTHEYLEECLNEQQEMEDMNIFQRL